MRVHKRIIEIYDVDFNDLIKRLRGMNKGERYILYKYHTNMLFPKSKKIVNLEDQLSNRSDYIHKFKRSFFIISNRFFSTEYFGEYNQEEFIKRTGYESQVYPQKVMLALSLMGYITKMSRRYSVGKHGYQYEVDYWKFKKWDKDFFVDIEFEEDRDDTCPAPDFGDEWLYQKQIHTFKSMEVDEEFFSELMREKEEGMGCTCSLIEVSKIRNFNHIIDMENLYHKKEGLERIVIDGHEGRLYSIMTRMKSEYRHGGVLSINGEKFREVDLSNAQPVLLALIVKSKHDKNYGEFKSMWLEHALKGDFYEWLVDITGLIRKYSVNEIIMKLEEENDRNIKSRKKKVKEKAEELKKVLDKVKEETPFEPKKKLRKLIKHWIIKFLFDKRTVSCKNNKVKSIETYFLKRLCQYLEDNESEIYNEILWYKKHPKPKKKKFDETASELARKLQEEEVRFIKQCLKRLDKEVKYLYTVHDCIGCLVSDVEKVKSIMEQTSLDYYGVRLSLKVE